VDPHTGSATPLLVLLAVLTLGYALACWAFPFRNCFRCHGTGRIRSEARKTFRWCRWCSGTGGRLRFGRHVWNLLARRHHRSNR
jgi:hypothetical protein